MRRTLIALAGVAALAFGGGAGPAPALSQETVELKLGHWIPAGHPMSRFLQEWADGMGEKSDGRIAIEVFPGGQLGPTPEYYDMVRRGVIDIGWILHGATPDRFPLTSLIDVPFTFDTAVHGTKILNDPELRAEYLDPEHRGVKVLMLFTHQPAQIHTAPRPVATPADLDGLRIRFPSAIAKEYLDALGADSVGLPPTAIAENLQKNVIDGLVIDYGGAGIAFKLGGLVNYVTDVDAYATSFGIIMNEDAFERIPDDLKPMFEESWQGLEEKVGGLWDSLDEPGKQALVDGGAEIIVPTDEAMAEFRRIGAEVGEKVVADREGAGHPGEAVRAKMEALADQHGR